MTAIELIENTIEYYKTHPRAIGPNKMCSYKSPEGNMCAVGRWVDWKNLPEGYEETLNSKGSIVNFTNKELKEILLPEVKNIPLELWDDLQGYHDYTLNIESNTESTIEIKQKELVEKYKNPIFA